MQPTLLTAIPVRLDLPDPGRCSECSRSAKERLAEQRKPRAKRRRRY
jgi:hypothetical protein